MRRAAIGIIVMAASIVPMAGQAHEYVAQGACADSASEELAHDCVRVDSDTEFEDGIIVTVDGDDSDPRPDGYSDGYVAVEVTTGGAAVYCEDEGGFNHIDDRPGGTEDDHNGDNDACGL